MYERARRCMYVICMCLPQRRPSSDARVMSAHTATVEVRKIGDCISGLSSELMLLSGRTSEAGAGGSSVSALCVCRRLVKGFLHWKKKYAL